MMNENKNAQPAIEHRAFHVSEMRVEKGEKRTISGHAAVFNSKSEEIFGIKGVREVIRPGAFLKTISSADVRALWNHDNNFVLGRTKNHTLELSEDEIGLKVRIFPPESPLIDGFMASIARGDVDQMSFGFRTVSDSWSKQGEETIRELIEVDLYDVSPVTFPAYKQTDVAVRSFIEAKIAELAEKSAEPSVTSIFSMRLKAQEEFINRRLPPIDPHSYQEIIKRAHVLKGDK